MATFTLETFRVPEDLPQPAMYYPFKPGEAVYYLPHPSGFCNQQELIPAMVLKAPHTQVESHIKKVYITILRADGRTTRVWGNRLAYQGYCSFCSVPAVVGCDDGQLICPQCGELATNVPPPDELTLRWYPLEHARSAQIARICAQTGCTYGEALEQHNTRSNTAFYSLLGKHGMLNEMWGRRGPWTVENQQFYWFCRVMEWYADLGDEESFLSYYRAHGGDLPSERTERLISFFESLLDGNGPGCASQRLQLAPLDIVRPASDSEPDGADELTAWLDQQFKHAA